MKTVPTTVELQTKLYQDMKISFGLENDDYKDNLGAFAGVIAAQLRPIYMYVADNRNNLYPDTADLAEDGGELERLGEIYLNRQPKLATEGKYLVAISGSAGSVLPASLTFKSNENSNASDYLFILDNSYELIGANDFIELRALTAGLESLLNVGDGLTATQPVVGLDPTIEVSEILEKPISAEPIPVYRKNVNDSIQLEPQGGAKTDYRLWSSDAQGVRLVYPYVKEGEAGTVQVYVEAIKEDSTDGLGTPYQQLLDEVEEVIRFDPDDSLETDYRGRIPMGVPLEVISISLKPVDINITGLSDSSTSMLQSIRNNIDSYLENIRPFVDGAELLRNKNDILYNYRLSGIVQDTIGNGNYFEDFEMLVDGNVVSNFTFSRSNIPYFRNLNLI